MRHWSRPARRGRPVAEAEPAEGHLDAGEEPFPYDEFGNLHVDVSLRTAPDSPLQLPADVVATRCGRRNPAFSLR